MTITVPPPRNTARHTRHANLVSMSDKGAADSPQSPPEEALGADQLRPARYLDAAGVGRWFNVPGTTVNQWRHRYDNTPIPDVIVGENGNGWRPDREEEWRDWHKRRIGQGKGGGRPRKAGTGGA
ncbi:hypothetical protein [Nonomuraea sp. NPDC049646]|uniref:hypothetical protein n=1 Tax=unclassified Nonomuraea TaxID=2593643 RepID=UPI00378F6319